MHSITRTSETASPSRRLASRWLHPMNASLVILCLAAPFLVGLGSGDYWVRVLNFVVLYVILALGLNVVVGFCGLLDLGFIAFYAVGAYTVALLSSPHLTTQFPWIASMFPAGLHMPIWGSILIAMAMAALFGILLGAPMLRLQGDYLAIVTLGFGEIVRIFMNNMDRPVNITNGPKGITGIDPVKIQGIDFSVSHEILGIEISSLTSYFYLFLACAVFVIFVCRRLQHSRVGRP